MHFVCIVCILYSTFDVHSGLSYWSKNTNLDLWSPCDLFKAMRQSGPIQEIPLSMNRFVYCPGGVVVFYRPKNSMLAPLPGVNQGSTYVPFSVLGFLFVLFLLPDFSQKKICINRFLCLLALTAR